MESPKKINPALAALIVIALIGISTSAIVLLKNDESQSTESSSTLENSRSSNTTPKVTDTVDDAAYKDGTYSAQGSYLSPGGRESIGLTVTLEDGVIVDTTLDQQASDGDAVAYQQKFASGYKAQVVGKSIDDVQLSRVAGSSLTSNGFNDAIEQIQADARG